MRLYGGRLRRAAQGGRRSGDGWNEVETADGVVALDLGQVVFVKLEPAEHRVGFSGAVMAMRPLLAALRGHRDARRRRSGGARTPRPVRTTSASG